VGLLFVSLLRLLLPLLILKWALLGMVVCSLLDAFDVYFPGFPPLESFYQYQEWDKILDLYYLSFALFVSFSWKDLLSKKISLLFYLLRATGTALFLITASRAWLFFFPNLFEYFYLFYLGSIVIFKQNLIRNKKDLAIIIGAIILLKLPQEYILHFKRYSFWNWFK